MFDSTTCYGKISNKPLKSYESEIEANQAVLYVKRTYGNEQVSYKCRQCGYWHLSGIDRQTPNYLSDCIDSSGNPKHAYESKEIAKKRAEIILKEKDVNLNVYLCDDCNKWHLTHKKY